MRSRIVLFLWLAVLVGPARRPDSALAQTPARVTDSALARTPARATDSARVRSPAAPIPTAGRQSASPDVPRAGLPAAAVAGDEVFYQIFVRSFRDSDGDRIGDLEGIRNGLGYLKYLGVTSILLTPINPSPFYHNYFASSFEGVDPAYGDARAFARLVSAVHALGMKIYLDEEIQYVAGGHPWWRESAGNPASRYSRYLPYDGPGNTKPESAVYGLTTTPTWDGRTIPLATVNLDEPAVRDYFGRLFASLADPNHDGRFDDGVDGFRLDHMMDDLDSKGRFTDLFTHFWAPVLAEARKANPRIRIIGEQADWGYGEDYLKRGGVDLVFAFPLRGAIVKLDRKEIAGAIEQTRARTPAGKGQIVFIENHDVPRFASLVGGDFRREKVGAALDLLLGWTPLIYYGQEIGMKGARHDDWTADGNDIPDREAFEWSRKVEAPGAALWYEGSGPWWTGRFARDDDGISVEEEKGKPGSLLEFYRRLIAIRRSRPELRDGDVAVVPTDRDDVLAILRQLGRPGTGGPASLLVVNLADSPRTVAVAAGPLAGRPLKDLVSGRSEPSRGETLRLELPPYAITVLAAR